MTLPSGAESTSKGSGPSGSREWEQSPGCEKTAKDLPRSSEPRTLEDAGIDEELFARGMDKIRKIITDHTNTSLVLGLIALTVAA